MSAELQTVGFAGAELHCVKQGEEVFVSLRRACEALGIDYSSQHRKLTDRHWATMVNLTTVAEDGLQRDLAMVDLDTLGMWLATIDARRVADDARPKVELYQQECVRVLRRHFFGEQKAEPKRIPVELETRYPDGRVTIERYQVSEQPTGNPRPPRALPAPKVDVSELRRRFDKAMRDELQDVAEYSSRDGAGRGRYLHKLNKRMKTVVGLPRGDWQPQHYHAAANWLLMHEGIRVHWALTEEAS